MSRIVLQFLIVLFAASTVVADDDRQLVAKGAKVEKLAGGMKFTEGPVWLPSEKKLVFSDIRSIGIANRPTATFLICRDESSRASTRQETSFASRPTAVQLCWRTALTANGSIRQTMWRSGRMELCGLQIRHGD